MSKRVSRIIVTSFIIFAIAGLYINYGYAQNSELEDNWGVTITSDSKEINDTHKIKFMVEENPDIVSGKIAPGAKAVAKIDINLEKANGKVSISAKIDDSKLSKALKMDLKLDNEHFQSEKTVTVDAGMKKTLILQLEWNENDTEDTIIRMNQSTIEVPVEIKVTQNI